MLSTDGGKEKKNLTEDLRELLPMGENESYFVLQKSGVTFNEKGENKHNVENLESSKLSAAAEDCGV